MARTAALATRPPSAPAQSCRIWVSKRLGLAPTRRRSSKTTRSPARRRGRPRRARPATPRSPTSSTRSPGTRPSRANRPTRCSRRATQLSQRGCSARRTSGRRSGRRRPRRSCTRGTPFVPPPPPRCCSRACSRRSRSTGSGWSSGSWAPAGATGASCCGRGGSSGTTATRTTRARRRWCSTPRWRAAPPPARPHASPAGGRSARWRVASSAAHAAHISPPRRV